MSDKDFTRILGKYGLSDELIDTLAGILELFPEYEPVELEALSDEEIHKLNLASRFFLKAHHNECDLDATANEIYRQGGEAVIQHNQAKYGQLFRVKE